MSELVVDKSPTKDLEIEKFLQGRNNKLNYLVNIVSNYFTNTVTLIFDDPVNGKYILDDQKYQPFSYFKDTSLMGLKLYFDNEEKEKKNKQIYGIKYKELNTYNHERLDVGYKYLFYGNSPSDLRNYFKEGKLTIVDENRLKKYLINYCGFIFDSNDEEINEKYTKIFTGYIKNGVIELSDQYLKPLYNIKPEEQYLIQNGARLYKGYEKYNEVHRLQFDIETTGLDPYTDRIFLIGIKDNRGFEKILEVKEKDVDKYERNLIKEFFLEIKDIKPAIITHYNGETFDWHFILKRCELLGIDINEKVNKIINNNDVKIYRIPTTLSDFHVIKRVDNATVKFGSDTERYTKTEIWGYSNVDIIHAVKKTQAINSEIKKVGLKYICKYEGIAKENRMYVEGNNIFKIWDENKWFMLNKSNNQYRLIPESYQNKPKEYIDTLKSNLLKGKEYPYPFDRDNINNIEYVNGKYIVERYLIDDLWETEQVDLKYNEASFLLAKLVPTTYERITTMGSAAVWKLIMTAWSYDNELAIPIPDPDNDKFSGGLARAFYIGFAENIRKLDFAGLYPSLQITYDIFPSVDVTNALKRLLTYLLNTRNVFKSLSNDDSLSKGERSFYKTKQLPLKILNNSLFGALGSGIAFPWGETVVSAQITCAGRLHLRKMIKYFMEYDFKPVLCVTDGVNFSIPDIVYKDINGNDIEDGIDINKIEYTIHGRTYKGVSAFVEKYNYDVLGFSNEDGRIIKVDDDGSFKSSLTVQRINYASLTFEDVDKKTGKIIPSKVKLTGNSIKSGVMPVYIEEFIDNGIRMILDNKPSEFIEYYYEYLNKIFYKRIPLKKIASKSKVKKSIQEYLNRGTDKNGRDKAVQAHMELIIKQGLTVEKGDTIHYVNIGTSKSHGDSKILKNKETGEEYFCSVIIREEDLDNVDNVNIEYNVKKYIASFNKSVENLLVGFSENVRKTLIKDVKTNRKEKRDYLQEREYYTDKDVVLKSFEKDNIEESMYLESLELDLWNKTGRDPRKIFDGFKIENEDDLKGVEEYQDMLFRINKSRAKKGDKLLKAIDDKYYEGDLVLKKFNNKYTVHRVENGYLLKIYEFN
jgi:DNA polymerase elongation subunit (family B)